MNGREIRTGDAVDIEGEPTVTITAIHPSELILVDVPPRWERAGVWAE